MIPGMDAMSGKGLQSYMDYAERELNRLGIYQTLSNIPEGKFLVEELRYRKDFVRGLYSGIDPAAENAGTLLAALQSWEAEIDEWIQRFTNAGKQADIIRKRIDECRQKISIKHEAERGNKSFLPSGYKGEKHDTRRTGSKGSRVQQNVGINQGAS